MRTAKKNLEGSYPRATPGVARQPGTPNPPPGLGCSTRPGCRQLGHGQCWQGRAFRVGWAVWKEMSKCRSPGREGEEQDSRASRGTSVDLFPPLPAATRHLLPLPQFPQGGSTTPLGSVGDGRAEALPHTPQGAWQDRDRARVGKPDRSQQCMPACANRAQAVREGCHREPSNSSLHCHLRRQPSYPCECCQTAGCTLLPGWAELCQAELCRTRLSCAELVLMVLVLETSYCASKTGSCCVELCQAKLSQAKPCCVELSHP